MNATRDSDALHARVQAFAEAWASGVAPTDSFEALALAIAKYQTMNIPGVRRLVEARAVAPSHVDDVPSVPVEAFRVARIAAHSEEHDRVRFLTSGTTGGAPGVHPLRTTETYRALAVAMGRAALASAWRGPRVVVALGAAPGPNPTSSLAFMMRAFIEEFDGRPLSGTASGAFDPEEPGRFLVGPRGVDIEGLERAAATALSRDEPLLVLGTSFALVLLLDALGGARMAMPERTVVMPTGGFKGRTREMASDTLVHGLASAFRIPEAYVVGEYGMTELSSQLYEGVLPGSMLSGERGVFLPPPWLRVTPVRPETLAPTSDGEPGLARFVDLGNIDFPVAIVTQDLIRRRGAGVELLGRAEGAPARGCSLAMEEMVLGTFAS